MLPFSASKKSTWVYAGDHWLFAGSRVPNSGCTKQISQWWVALPWLQRGMPLKQNVRWNSGHRNLTVDLANKIDTNSRMLQFGHGKQLGLVYYVPCIVVYPHGAPHCRVGLFLCYFMKLGPRKSLGGRSRYMIELSRYICEVSSSYL